MSDYEKYKKKVKLALARRVLRSKKRPQEMTTKELDAVIAHYQEQLKTIRFAFAVLLPLSVVFFFLSSNPQHIGLAALVIIVILVSGTVGMPYYTLKVRRLKKMLAFVQRAEARVRRAEAKHTASAP